MIAFINYDGGGCIQQGSDVIHYARGKISVTFCDIKIFGAVYADDSNGFVRVSIPPEKDRAFVQATKGLFNNFNKIGKYDGGNIGYEFTAPNLKIQIG